MTTETGKAGTSSGTGLGGWMAGTGYFLLHYFEMCGVMCLGGVMLLSALLRAVAPLLGVRSVRTEFPVLATALLAAWLTLLMIGWMRLRSHDWRPTLEMASTSVIAFPVLLGGAALGIVSSASLFGLECGLACVLMVVAMLARLGHYTGPHDAAAHAAHAGQHQHM